MKSCPKCGYYDGINGQEMRRIRITKGVTLRVLAAAVGVSVSYLSDIENGNRPGAAQKNAIAKALGVLPKHIEYDPEAL